MRYGDVNDPAWRSSAHPVGFDPLEGDVTGDGETRNRTEDTTIFSRMLYQLSYLAATHDASA